MIAWSELATEILDHAFIIRMLILRNLRSKYRSNPLGFMLEFLQPIVVCSVHYEYFSLTGRDVPNQAYLLFTIGGFSIWFCFASAYMGTLKGSGGTAGLTEIPGVTLIHVYLSRAIWAFLLFLLFSYIIAFLAMEAGAPIRPPSLVLTATDYGLAAGLGFAFGLVSLAIGDIMPALIPFIKLFRWAIFITSGIYNSLSTMPRIEATYVWYNPLIHLAEYQRHAFDTGYPVFYARLWYPTLVLLGLLFFGLAADRALARRGRGMNAFIV